jgi:hypothetical protein
MGYKNYYKSLYSEFSVAACPKQQLPVPGIIDATGAQVHLALANTSVFLAMVEVTYISVTTIPVTGTRTTH